MTRREWLGAGLIGAAVFLFGLFELYYLGWLTPYRPIPPALALLVALGTAVGVARWAPEVALGAAWVAGLVQLLGDVPVLFTDLALLFVLFAVARWGRAPGVVLAGLSVVFIPLLALTWVRNVGLDVGLAGKLLFSLLGAPGAIPVSWQLVLLVVGLATLGIPYLSGLALRFRARARTAQEGREVAETEAAHSQEIAQLQEAQNRLARDVHDVVGHSLTVILAQAESAQFIEDPDRLKRTMQIIASSARTSLQDVRQVLTPGQESAAGRRGGLDTLIEAIRTSGHPIVSSEAGEARPLPPELDAVAYRVLQEMLTNAIKHGRRDQPVLVDRRWPEPASANSEPAGSGGRSNALRIEVRNSVDGEPAPEAGPGQGLAGMRRRLDSVGGRLEVQGDDSTFTAIALVPVRAPLPEGPL